MKRWTYKRLRPIAERNGYRLAVGHGSFAWSTLNPEGHWAFFGTLTGVAAFLWRNTQDDDLRRPS